MRFTDLGGLRLFAFATSPTGVPIDALELRHRRRARAEERASSSVRAPRMRP